MGFFGSYEARRVHEQRTAPLEPKSGLVGPPARVSHNRARVRMSPTRWLSPKRVQRSFDSRSVAALLRASLRMTVEKSERSDSCVVANSCLSQRPSQSSKVLTGAPLFLGVANSKIYMLTELALHCLVSLKRANGFASPLTTLSSRSSQVLVLRS